MVNYVCYRCNYTTHIKTIMNRHLSRQTPCKSTHNQVDIDDCKQYVLQGYSYKEYLKLFKKVSNGLKPDEIVQKDTKWDISGTKKIQNSTDLKNINESECKYCKKILSCQKSLKRHYKTCKEKKEDDAVKQSMTDLVKLLNEKDKYFKEELDKRDNEFKEELKKRDNELNIKEKEYRSQINELIKKAGINNSTITQNIQNNIKLLSYGKTDISHLTDNDFIGCLKHKNFCIPYLIEKIHFDKNKPENHNIYISNLKNKYVMMYEKRKWKTKNRNEAIEKLICDKEQIMGNKIGEWEDQGDQYAELSERFNIYMEKRGIKTVIDQIKDDIELMLYNNKDLIKK